MLYKIDALKNLEIFTEKYPCWSFFLINVIKRDSKAGTFLWIWQNFKYSFLYRPLPVHYTFPKLYVMIEFLGRLWVRNWYFSYLFCHCFTFLGNSDVRMGSLLLFRICNCYFVVIPKFLLSVTFARTTTTAPSLLWLNH